MPKAVNPESLTQSQAAWLIGKPAVWLRDNAHLILRNSDATYDARELVEAVRKQASTEIPPLADADAERAAIVADRLTIDVGYDAQAIADFAADIERRYGVGGLAAMMRAIVAQCATLANILGTRQLVTEATIRDKHEHEIRRELEWRNRTLFEQTIVCGKCGKIRRGEQWLNEKPLENWVQVKDVCPSCINR